MDIRLFARARRLGSTIPLTVMLLTPAVGAVAQSPDTAASPAVPAPPSTSVAGQSDLETYFSEWFQRVDTALATQPSWAAPLVMATPRIVELFRFDTSLAEVRTGVNLDNYGLGRGLSLVPNETTQVTLGVPPYEIRTGGRQPGAGFADLPFLTVKERLFAATEQQGNYLVTAFLGAGAPTGVPLYTQHTYTITPGLYAGKGWGRFDVEASSSVSFPVEDVAHIGTSIVSNLVFQYHFARIFWPEIEFNHTYWIDGVRGGRSQLFTTIGLVLGRFELVDRLKMTVGAGYQVAIAPVFVTRPEVVPTYRDAVVTTFRLSF